MGEPINIGRQTPTETYAVQYINSFGEEAIQIYEESGRKAQPWQSLLIEDILAVSEEGKYLHTRCGYSVPRRNGKGEILTIRELYGLEKGEQMLHTAHRTSTSTSASRRLEKLLRQRGYQEVIRVKQGEEYEKSYVYSKQGGKECIKLLDTGGVIYFRTRTSSGGLGEGFDVRY